MPLLGRKLHSHQIVVALCNSEQYHILIRIISAVSLFHTLDLDPSVSFLGPEFCSQPIRLLHFGVSFDLGP